MKIAAALIALTIALPAAAQDFARGRLIVGVDPADEIDVDKEMKRHRGKRGQRFNRIDAYVFELPAGVDEKTVLKQLRGKRGIKFIQLDQRHPPGLMLDDPYLNSAWHLSNINAQSAWDISSGQGVTMAVCDTGVNPHPDLDLVLPGFNTFDNNTNSADVYGHGTKVAGSVAMIGNNAIGGAGIAYKTRILPIRISDANGWGYDSAIANCITKAADMGARGANVSYGVCDSPIVLQAIQYMRNRGGVVTVSAGNSGAQMTSANSNLVTCVSASDSSDNKTGWSNYGVTVDIMAPGDNVFTTTREGGYSGASGTSFAAPVTLGVYALMMAANPNLTPTELDDILFSTAKDVGQTGYDNIFGHGRIDAYAAVAKAAGQSGNTLAAPVNLRVSP